MSEQRTMTVQMAADDVGVHRNSIYNAARRGDIQLRKMGRRTFILRDDWDAYLRSLPVVRLGAKS